MDKFIILKIKRLKPIRLKWRKNNLKKCLIPNKLAKKNQIEKYQATIEKGRPKRRIYVKKYYQENKKSILKKKYKRLQEDNIFRLKELVRSRIQSGLRHNTKKKMK